MNTYYTIFVNGEALSCVKAMYLYDLLLYLNFDIKRIIVEHNKIVVSNDLFKLIYVTDQDTVEVITIVGGG